MYYDLIKNFIDIAVKDEYADLITPADIENMAHELNGDKEFIDFIYVKVIKLITTFLENKENNN